MATSDAGRLGPHPALFDLVHAINQLGLDMNRLAVAVEDLRETMASNPPGHQAPGSKEAIRYVRLQVDARLRQQLGGTLAFANQLVESIAFLRVEPDHVFLDGNLFPGPLWETLWVRISSLPCSLRWSRSARLPRKVRCRNSS